MKMLTDRFQPDQPGGNPTTRFDLLACHRKMSCLVWTGQIRQIDR